MLCYYYYYSINISYVFFKRYTNSMNKIIHLQYVIHHGHLKKVKKSHQSPKISQFYDGFAQNIPLTTKFEPSVQRTEFIEFFH